MTTMVLRKICREYRVPGTCLMTWPLTFINTGSHQISTTWPLGLIPLSLPSMGKWELMSTRLKSFWRKCWLPPSKWTVEWAWCYWSDLKQFDVPFQSEWWIACVVSGIPSCLQRTGSPTQQEMTSSPNSLPMWKTQNQRPMPVSCSKPSAHTE